MSKLLYTDFREEGIVIRVVRGHVKLKKKKKKTRSRIFITRRAVERLLQRRIPYIFTIRYDKNSPVRIYPQRLYK